MISDQGYCPIKILNKYKQLRTNNHYIQIITISVDEQVQ